MLSQFTLLAESAAGKAAEMSGPTFQWGRVESPIDWIVPLLILIGVGWFVIGMYVLDCKELGARLATMLIGLRLVVLVGLLAIYLQPQWRDWETVPITSRALLLVDTSQSMGKEDATGGQEGTPDSAATKRIDRVVDELQNGTVLEELRQLHDVVVYRFAEDDKPTVVASYEKIDNAESKTLSEDDISRRTLAVVDIRKWLMISGGLFVAGLLVLSWFLVRPKGRTSRFAWPAVLGSVAMLAAIALVSITLTRHDDIELLSILGIQPVVPEEDQSATDEPSEDSDAPADVEAIQWAKELLPSGGQTKLGQAIARLVQDEGSTPVSAIICFSDGRNNSGMPAKDAATLAKESGIPVHTIGLGSDEKPESVRIETFSAPRKAKPNSPFKVTAFLSSKGLAGRNCVVTLKQLTGSAAGDADGDDLGILYEKDTTLDKDGKNVSIVFDVEGIEQKGRYRFELAIERPRLDSSIRSTEQFTVDVVKRKTNVLLIAGGPLREYRFLRDTLLRDTTINLEILLQSASGAISQGKSAKLLASFPEEKTEFENYDCVIALDPDFFELNEGQVDMIENWVAESAGGLIVIPGPVYAGKPVRSWIHAADYEKLRALVPVVFHSQFAEALEQQTSASDASKIEFTREGLAAPHLRLADNPFESTRIWESFQGVFGGFPVRSAKEGATVYANYADDRVEITGSAPVYMAGQLYGSGRVFYLGSGEMWRLRRLNPDYFTSFYTELIQHVSQGRMLRDSRRGDVLLVEDRPYQLGDAVPVTARLKNAAHDPLDMDQVTLFVLGPNGRREPLAMKQDSQRRGMYRGQFVVRQEGEFHLQLPLPESGNEVLTKTVKVTTEALESMDPQRNDDLLAKLATTTGGEYYVGIDSALGRDGGPSVVGQLQDRTERTPVMGDTDPVWDAWFAKLMMFSICGVLCLEWLLRRLFKLA